MASKSRPYEQFGSFILFKRLETDALGDLWRAGKIDGGQLAGTVALRRLSGGNREAIAQSAAEAREIVPMLHGTSFVRNQSIEVVDGVPAISYEYAGGRSLRHIVDRARGGTNQMPNPIPIEQAIVVAEKVALSLATTGDLKYGEKRLLHGALLPQFIWISDDGEIRVAGQQLGRGVIASLRDTRVAGEISRYIAPEIRATAEPTKSSEVFAMGAILHLLVTGEEPPDALTTSAFAQAVRAAKTMSGHDMPPEIRAILEKSLAVDPATRYPSMTEMKQAISALAHGGKYSATTFNLAFYLSNLLKKEMESEAIDREKESKVNVAPYAEPAAPYVPTPPPAFLAQAETPKKSKLPLYAAAAIVLLGGIGVGAYVMTRGGAKPAPAPAPPVTAQMTSPAPVVVSQPVVAATSTTSTVDPEAQKKAFEQAVAQRLQEEVMKLQKDYTQQLKQQQSKNAPVTTQASAPPQQQRPQPAEERSAPSAAALDERRLEQKQAQTTPQQTATQQPAPQQAAQSQPQQQQQAAPPPVHTVREGDVIDFTELDAPVSPLNAIRPVYPPMAMRAKAQAMVVLTTLIDEDGRVIDVKVLRGDPRFGFNEEAVRAIRATRFSPPRKDGKRVKTWRPQTISFTL